MQPKLFIPIKKLASTAAARGRRWRTMIIVAPLALAGCASPYSDPSPLMHKAAAPAGAVAADKSMVRIHRPRAMEGYKLYTGVWDSGLFIADLGNGNSVAYVCEPGTHHFLNRSVERVGVVEARLLPAQTYDLWVDTAGAFVASFQLEPVNRGSKQWELVPTWVAENWWMERAPPAAEYEAKHQKDVEIILKDFVGGDKKDRLRYLGPDDHR